MRAYLDSQSRTVDGPDYYEPLRPLELEGRDGKLRVSVSFRSHTDDLTLILEEHRDRAVDDFHMPGLTRREAEILFWISKGKTDSDVAAICSISVRTVQKHVENVFVKLGVETRTAAVMTALDQPGL
ncbi:MAG: helix-turn-helix transcriptional regulator [Acidobacteriota bacterium]